MKELLYWHYDTGNLKQELAVVGPICIFCIGKGEHPETNHPVVVPKRK